MCAGWVFSAFIKLGAKGVLALWNLFKKGGYPRESLRLFVH